MDIFQSIAPRLIFIFGIVNLVFGFTIFFSCRCIPGWKLTSSLMKYAAYKRFFKYHCYLWCIFWPSVVVHAIVAIVFFGVPL
jgi:hypothetical protein